MIVASLDRLSRGGRPIGFARRLRQWLWGAGMLASGCQTAAERQPIDWHEESGYRWRDVQVDATRPTGFTALNPRKTGITFNNDVSDSAAKARRVLAHGAGVAVGDVDGDGRVDLFFARTLGKNALYKNLGNWKFDDIAEEAGVAEGTLAGSGATLVDVDGDRDLDLLVEHIGGPNTLYLNDGRGKFTVDSAFPGNRSNLGSVTATLADVEGDGDLDLYIVNHKTYPIADRRSHAENAYEKVTRPNAAGIDEVREEFRNDAKFIGTGMKRRLVERADPDGYYLNDGKGRFTQEPIAGSPRFLDEKGNPLTDEPEHFGLAGRFYDINDDLAPDLYVTNDFDNPDQFWINDGEGRFRLLDGFRLRNTSLSTMSIDFADVDRDGYIDFFEADMLSRDTRHLHTQLPSPIDRRMGPEDFDRQTQIGRNGLYRNRGDGSYEQIAELSGIDASGWTWGSLFLDVDLDGYEDVLTAAGHKWDEGDADIRFKAGNEVRMQDAGYPELRLRNTAFRNRGDLTFEEVGERWGFGDGPNMAHGIALGDFDGDGDLDVVMNRLNQEALVLRNDAPQARIAVRLNGKPPNTFGVGAKIRVRGGPVPFQEREVTAGGLYLSHSDYLLTFATGTADSVEVEVLWRNGTRSVIAGVKPNRIYEIDEASAAPAPPKTPPPPPEPLFSDKTNLLGHTHVDPIFGDETLRQPLLLNRLSDLGPGATWADLDRDGDDDLVVTSGRTGTLQWFRNTGGRFAPIPLIAKSPGDQTMTIPLPRPSGATMLLVGQSNYEAIEDAIAMPGVVGLVLDGTGRPRGSSVPVAQADTGTVGPLAVADLDGDRRLDLFVGSRVTPGEYPRSRPSRLYKQAENGTLVLDTVNAGALSSLGMVSGAVFSDLDGDADPDLVLAVEWGPITVLLNDHGKLERAPASWGFDRLPARWFGVATGDFDGDGRPDIVTTSLGRNLRNLPDSANPLLLYSGYFDQGFSVDVILARYDPRLDAIGPVTFSRQIRLASREIASRTGSFATFADATLESILGAAAKRAEIAKAVTFDQLVWFNRGDHFEPVPLPVNAQMAPAFAPVVTDFNGDGFDDVFLSQNLSSTLGFDAPLDAGRGLLLLGNGSGGFDAMPGHHSGLVIYGDQRGAATADYDGDGRMDLVVTQNGMATRLFRNERGQPGVRIRLEGRGGNPSAIGAAVRLACGDWRGPLREIQAGGGYWSANSPVTVLTGVRAGCSVEVRWPDGRRTTAPIPAGRREIVIGEPAR